MRQYCKNIDITDRDFILGVLEEFKSSGKRNKGKFREFFAQGDDAIIAYVQETVRSRELHVGPLKHMVRHEPTSGKTRDIWEESPEQQFLDWIGKWAIDELLQAKVEFHQCASVPGKGQKHARKYIQRWVRDTRMTVYVKLDIRKYYNSVNRRALFRMLERDIRNDDVLWLIKALVMTHHEGLNIGSYLSQYLANYYLSDAFRFVQSAHKERRGKKVKLVKHVLTYMDDWLLMGRDKRDLKMAVRRLSAFLLEKLGLSVKPWKVCRVDCEPIDMVGFVFRRDRTTIRAGIFLRARRAYRRARQAIYVKRHQAARVASYWGYFKVTDTRRFKEENHIAQTLADCRNSIALNQIERNFNELSLLCGAA